jgi:hypothetical protein
MGGYSDLRLRGELRSRAVDIEVYLNNALDTRGDTLAFGNPFSFRAEAQTTPQQPRTVGILVHRRF